ncbi:MAG TPA: two-component regulator propeller domain-containing protein [Chitinophagaceae bacterium]|nr:two-component regulator propeller domain-containing protein [Chitinophagaceae bacterium]
MPFRFLFFLFFPLFASAQNNLPPVGAWREHLPYGNAVAVAATDTKIFCATPYSLFSVAPQSGEQQRFSKISGLSETGVSTIGYDAVLKKLVIAYSNSNIDVLGENKITNIPDLKREITAGDKTIYQVFPAPGYCYLATGLGIVVLNLEKGEIKDTWRIGEGGSAQKVTALATTDSLFYAATDGGLKMFHFRTGDGADFRNWHTLSPEPTATVANLENHIIAVQRDSLFKVQDGVLKNFYADGWPVVSITASEGKLFVCERTSAGDSRVVVLHSDGSVKEMLSKPGVVSFPAMGVSKNGVYWIADLYSGLSSWAGTDVEQYRLNSPGGIATGAMTIANGVLYAAAGSVNDAWNYQYNANGIYGFQNEYWTTYNRFQFPALDSVLDFIAVAVDPRDGSLWGGSFGGGLVHIKKDNTLDILKGQTPLGAAIGDPGSYRISGLAFDAEANLWISNYGAATYLHVLKKDGSWQSFTTPFSFAENSVAQVVIDDAGQKWIVSPKGGGLILFNDGGTIENGADDRWKLYKGGAGNGNLPSSDVLCIAKDKDGFIWVGTSDGAGFIPCSQDVFAGNCEAVLPVLKEGAFAGYLFKGEAVQSIAVDGANRKWMATRNGVWLLNADGDKVLLHFTETNSALLSNDVRSIAINGQTGEVFFATAKGICSFRGSATEIATTGEPLQIFPNPVQPGYGGTIAVKGLPEGAVVKITELNGRVVFVTKALGGQAVWNGRDYTGKKIASGVYLVLATTGNRRQARTGKIVFISK